MMSWSRPTENPWTCAVCDRVIYDFDVQEIGIWSEIEIEGEGEGEGNDLCSSDQQGQSVTTLPMP